MGDKTFVRKIANIHFAMFGETVAGPDDEDEGIAVELDVPRVPACSSGK